MADTKISGLVAAAAALDTHEYPVNESGVSLKVTTAQVRTLFTGGTNAFTGANSFATNPLNLLVGQVTFPATQNPSAGVNVLDDYEEGPWTPVLTFATPGDLSVAYSAQVGRYTKIGRRVSLQFNITTSTFTHTTASGAMQITGVPIAHLTLASSVDTGSALWSGITKAGYTQVNPQIGSAAVLITMVASGSAVAASTVVAADMPTTGTVMLQGTLAYDSA